MMRLQLKVKYRRYELIMLLLVAVFIGVVAPIANSAQEQSVPSKLSIDGYSKLFSLLFPKTTDRFDPVEAEFALDVLVRPSFKSPRQVSIVKLRNQKLSITSYEMVNTSESIGWQINRLLEDGASPDPQYLYKQLEVTRTEVLKPDRYLPLITEFFRPFSVPKTVSFSLDGVGYDIWYIDSGSRTIFVLGGGEDFEKGESNLITWARRLVKKIPGNAR